MVFLDRSSGLEEHRQSSSVKRGSASNVATGVDVTTSAGIRSQGRRLHPQQATQPETRFEVSLVPNFPYND